MLLKTRLHSVQGRSGQRIKVRVEDENGVRILEDSDLLAAVGRAPNTHGIGLEQAGIKLSAQGFVEVNERLETTAPNVWAMGDCAGGPRFTHVSFR